MSFSVNDHIKGKKITLVYGVKSSTASNQLGFVEKSKSFGAFVKRNDYSHSFFQTRGQFDIIYAAKSAGVCFTPIIEGWLENLLEGETDIDPLSFSAGVIFPLDKRLYMAEIRNGSVVEEFILLQAKAEEKVGSWENDGLSLFCFEGGKQGDWASKYAAKESLSVDPTECRLKPNLISFAKEKLIHRQHIIAFTLGLILPVAIGLMLPFDDRSGEEKQFIPRPVIISPQSKHSAADQLRKLAIALHMGQSLYTSGLTEIIYSGLDKQIAYFGQSQNEYPRIVQKFGEDQGFEYGYTKKGWSLLRKTPKYEKLTIDAATTESQVLGTVLSLTTISIGTIALESTIEGSTSDRYVYTLSLPAPTPYTFHHLADHLQGYPVTVNSMACAIVPSTFSIETCLVTLSAIAPH